MKKYIFAALFAFMLVSLVPAANSFAQQRMRDHRKFGGKENFWNKLNLTKDQKDQIDKFRTDHQKETIDLQADIKKNRLQIKELLKSNNLDEGKIRSLVDKNSDLQAKIKDSALNMLFKSYSVLNDNQKELVREHIPSMLERGFMNGKHRGGRMGMGM